ncbi:MAG: Fe-S cluster assembly protein SufD [Candidatus Omnitrophica bacterium]|nr:Fe-S cluster assembly protein SufD [Candidatus Omnitrophota bacterium]
MEEVLKRLGPESSSRLLRLRREGWEKFNSLPWPLKTDEEWRRTDPDSFRWEPAGFDPKEALQVSFETPAPEWIRSGVIVTDLSTALRQFPDLMEKHLFRTGRPLGLAKHVSLHEALWRQGVFVFVPDGVKIPTPLRVRISESAGALAFFPHVVIVMGRRSEATLIDERIGAAGGGNPAFSDEMVEISVGEEGTLRYIHLQQWGENISEIYTQRTEIARDASFLNIHAALGAKATKAQIETILQEKGAQADLLGVLFGSDSQHFDFHTVQDHRSGQTRSDLLYKSALKDSSKAVYTGLIRIEKQAQKSDAYQANRNLLLSDGASADSVPMLEILADDVRCTHGVAVGPVDQDQIYYLNSRGLAPAEAEHLIVEGFFEQILQRIPAEELRERLMSELKRRLNGA